MISAAAALTTTAARAQAPFTLGEKVAYAGIGLGGFAGVYGNTTLPPISVGLDYGIADKISVGGLIGFARSSFDYTGYSWSYNYIVVAGRGAYHFGDLLKDALKGAALDPYVGLTLGYNIVSASYSGPSGGVITGSSGSYLLFGADVGARYWFTQNLGAQLEIGYGVGILNLGIAYKF